ncbi:hypothetical protein HSR121_1559 [Halapricum desulfuricans]|uniref:Uncharacterized protein n=1 Tax=Halapricum desulfuricans TaxID=2841257 RepID=A0A897N492_9EURY|nr:hypothetical protein HSR121_1559 [Halapricum desulfuricans]
MGPDSNLAETVLLASLRGLRLVWFESADDNSRSRICERQQCVGPDSNRTKKCSLTSFAARSF